MIGTGLTIEWKEMNLVCGRSRFQTLVESQPFLTIRRLNFDLSMAMEYGLIEFQHGPSMRLLILLDLQLPMREFTGIHRLQKGLFRILVPRNCSLFSYIFI